MTDHAHAATKTAESPPAASAVTPASRLGMARYPGPSLAAGDPPGTGGEPGAARWNSTRAAGMRSCSRASRVSARASAAVGGSGPGAWPQPGIAYSCDFGRVHQRLADQVEQDEHAGHGGEAAVHGPGLGELFTTARTHLIEQESPCGGWRSSAAAGTESGSQPEAREEREERQCHEAYARDGVGQLSKPSLSPQAEASADGHEQCGGIIMRRSAKRLSLLAAIVVVGFLAAGCGGTVTSSIGSVPSRTATISARPSVTAAPTTQPPTYSVTTFRAVRPVQRFRGARRLLRHQPHMAVGPARRPCPGRPDRVDRPFRSPPLGGRGRLAVQAR